MDAICFFSQFPNMGWKWTVQNLLSIHVYHKILWESQFNPYFYKIFQGIMLPIHKTIFYGTTPRFSKEAKIDIFLVERWFNEETFTYIRVFWSIVAQYVLPYYVLDKILAREIAYQIVGQGGLTKSLREQKKAIWLAFLLKCGAFTLHDYGHAVKEVEIITPLNWPQLQGYSMTKIKFLNTLPLWLNSNSLLMKRIPLMTSFKELKHLHRSYIWHHYC